MGIFILSFKQLRIKLSFRFLLALHLHRAEKLLYSLRLKVKWGREPWSTVGDRQKARSTPAFSGHNPAEESYRDYIRAYVGGFLGVGIGLHGGLLQ